MIIRGVGVTEGQRATEREREKVALGRREKNVPFFHPGSRKTSGQACMEIWLAGPILPDRLRACEREPARGGSKRMGRRKRGRRGEAVLGIC